MRRKRFILPALVLLFLALAAALWLCWGLSAQSLEVLKYGDVLSQPPVTATYHSVNNWQTEQDTDFKGVPLYELLEKYGVTDPAAQVKLIAPDGYFWPAVDTTLQLADLRKPNQRGLYSLLAYELDGTELQPEPEGSGPLRFVMPQYEEGQVNKPSWVSNVRLIEVGPLQEGFQAPDPARVPVDEVWIYGNLPISHTFPLWPAAAASVVAALLVLGMMLGHWRGKQRLAKTVMLALAVLVIAASSWGFINDSYVQADSSKIFSLSDLKSMPAFSGHYTFLKSQEPYTYYEKDYTGVSLSYLIEQAMTLSPAATGLIVRARDGYKVNLSLDQARKSYPGGLKTIVAYASGGQSLEGEEGPLRLIVPQETPGNKSQGGDANTPACERMVCAVEVTPLPDGMTAPSVDEIPPGSLAVYGAVSVPAQSQVGVSPSGGSEKKPQSPAPQTSGQAPAEQGPAKQAANERAATEIELLNNPLWGHILIFAVVFGSPTWFYSLSYLELQLRTGAGQ